LQLLVGKWFLGADHPRVDAGVTYTTVRGTLFDTDGPSFTDVAQGNEGDCWLMASLATLAAHDSSVIKDLFIYNGGAGNGIAIWTVRFFVDGSPVYVTVDNQLPTQDGSIYYARPQDGVLWVALAEKAYAQLNEFVPNITRFPGKNSYAALDEGNGHQVIKTFATLTGQDATGELPGAWSQLKVGRPAVLLTGDAPGSPYLLKHHFYAAIDHDPWTGMFQLFDPYGIQKSHAEGRYGLFWAAAPFLDQNYLYDVAVSDDVAAFAGGTEPTESLPALVAESL
jgi:hypothetical protein